LPPVDSEGHPHADWHKAVARSGCGRLREVHSTRKAAVDRLAPLRGEKLGLNGEELAFYDARATHETAVRELATKLSKL